MAANFHHWETDPFFLAAEQVQDSADRLESMFRFWMQSKNFMSEAQEEKELGCRRRDLGTALDTAKWQLEAFEKTVSALAMAPQHREQHDEDDASERYNQFIVAIRSQITSIENALLCSKDAMDLRARLVINLDQDEKDDLARFLRGPRDYVITDIGSSRNRPSQSLTSLRATDASPQSQEEHTRDKNDDCPGFYGRKGLENDLVAADLQRIGNGLCDQLPLSHSASERLLRDEDCVEDNLCKERSNGHHRSISLGGDWNNCQNGSLLVSAEKPSRISENTSWSLFLKPRMCLKSGVKRWKDGDATESEHQQIPYITLGTNDCEKGYYKPEESVPSYFSSDVKRYLAFTETMQSFQFLSRPRMQIASFVLAACGLLGLLSFNAPV